MAHDDTVSVGDLGHPKGTLAVLLLYLALFVLGWVVASCSSCATSTAACRTT